MKKALKISLGATVGLILIVFIGVFALLKPLVEYGLHRAGFMKAHVETADFSFSGTTLKNIRLDEGDSSVGEIKLYATLGDFLGGHLTKVEVHDAKIVWPMQMAASGKSAGALNLFTHNFEMSNAVVTVKTPAGDLPVTMEGTVTDRGETYKADMTVTAASEFAKLDGKLTADLTKASRAARIEFKVNDARVTQPDFEFKRASGWVQVDIDPAKPLPIPTAQLDFGTLTAYGLPLQKATLKALTADNKTEFLATAEVPNDSGDIALDFSLDQKDAASDKMTLHAEAKLRKLDALGLANLKGEGNFMLSLTGSRAKSPDFFDMTQWQDLQGAAGIDMQKLSLPGLLSNAQAIATVKLGLDTGRQVVTAQAVDGTMSFDGTVKPIDAAPLTLNIPANAKSPATITWDQKAKTLKTDFDGADFTGLKIMVKQMAGHLTADLAQNPALHGSLTLGELSHMAMPKERYFLPVRLALKFQPLEETPSTTAIKGDITEKNGRLSAKITGKHDIVSGRGTMSVSMPPTKLVKDVTALATLFPISQNYLTDGYGEVGLSADIDWAHTKKKWDVTSKGQLYLKDFDANIGGNEISGINTVMDLTSLFPLTLDHQQVAVGSVNVGLPLTNGLATISLGKAGSFDLHSASWTLAKGQVTSSPFHMTLPDISTDVTLTASGLDLAELFKIAPTEGLQATGTVAGSLPVQVRAGTFTIVNGNLQTTGAGTILYSPDKLPSFLKDSTVQSLVDLKTLLTHFDYDSLSMAINGTVGQSQKIALHVKGKNPLFYSGRPVEFNLNLEGPLENVLKYSPGGSQIPDSIKNQLEAYEASHAKL